MSQQHSVFCDLYLIFCISYENVSDYGAREGGLRGALLSQGAHNIFCISGFIVFCI